MEFLSKIAEYTIEPVGRLLGRQVGYVIHCKTNLQNLQAKVEELKAARQTVQNKVAEAERKGKDIRPDVKLWLTKVGEITAQADELISDESQAKLKCLHGFCPNLAVRHQLSRKSTKLLQDVVDQYEKREFPEVSCGILRKDVWSVTTGDYQALESRRSIMKEIMDTLKDPDIQRIGVYGIGGVGKTTLVKEVYKQASADKMLLEHVVILLDVKSTPDPEAIQKIILDMLGMKIKKNETLQGRASRLCAEIQGKKILVILDDVQEKIDLEVVGLPRLPTCKILVTCRTRDVLSFDKMRVDKEFQLHLLGEEETWSLFVKMAGDVVRHKGRIQDVAIQVAKKCGGLPLLVVTVASALKEKNKLGEWKDALRRLTKFDKEESTEKAYLALEWSYNKLDDKELKPLFLLSGIIVHQNNIHVQDLLKYGVGLGFFTNVSTLEEARNALDTLLGKLKDSCLLLDGDTEGVLRMHDLVCHVANLIAYRDHHMLSIEHGELKEWPNEDFLKKCSRISLIHGNIPTFPDRPMECPELELFFLYSSKNDRSVQIPSNFFSEMKKLRVLDLTDVDIPSLPLSLQYLKELQTLCLDDCELGDTSHITLLGQLSSLEVLSLSRSNVRELPKEIGQLTSLRLLDLSRCRNLEGISPNVISRLVKLEDLNMRDSFKKWEVEGNGNNATLSELKHLSRLSSLEIHIPNVDALPANLFPNKLERFNICIGDVWEARAPWEQLSDSVTLKTLKLKLTKELDESLRWLIKNSEYLSLDETEVVIARELNAEDFENMIHLQLQNNVDFMAMVNKKVVFPNLETLWVHGCDNLEFLFSFSMAKSLVQLTHLKVSTCKLLQEIVSSTREDGEESIVDVFSKLKVLKLKELPNLARFCAGEYIEFSSLVELDVESCDSLGVFIGGKVSMSKKDTRSCNEIEQTVSEEEENIDVKSNTTAKNFLFDEKVVFRNLVTLWVHGCDNLKFLFSFSMAKSLVQLTHLKVSKCKLLQEIVSSTREDGEESTVDMFSKLEVLKLEKLPNLARFSTGEYIEFSSLVELEVTDCDNLGVFIGGNVSMSRKDSRSCNEIEQTVLEEEENIDVKSEIAAKNFLFNEKVGFPILERLSVNGIGELKAIWHIQLSQNSFRRLKKVNVGLCNNLICLFPPSVMGRLNALETLSIRECESIEEIVGAQEEREVVETRPSEYVFPSVTSVQLYSLPQLMGCINASQWPSLKRLNVYKCAKVGFLATEVSHFGKNYEMETLMTSERPLFLIDNKDSFHNLETIWLTDMEIWKGPLPADPLVFGKLKSIRVRGDCALLSKQDSVLFLQRLQNLEEITIEYDSYETIISGEEIHDDAVRSATFPRVRRLQLFDMKKLMHLRNDNSQSLLFPNLETLELWSCSRLKSMESNAISFRNLTTLKVWYCDGFECFISYSVAKSLVQLKTLEAGHCESVVVIVGSNVGDDDAADDAAGNEIVFSHLQRLTLGGLDKLQGFCSGNCTVKLPSSITLDVFDCPIKFKLSSDGVLLTEVKDRYVQKDDDEQQNDTKTAQTTTEIQEEHAI